MRGSGAVEGSEEFQSYWVVTLGYIRRLLRNIGARLHQYGSDVVHEPHPSQPVAEGYRICWLS